MKPDSTFLSWGIRWQAVMFRASGTLKGDTVNERMRQECKRDWGARWCRTLKTT